MGRAGQREDPMRTELLASITAAALVMLPLAAQAQGTVRGAQEGAEAGGRAAGPVGAVVGGTIGAATGTVGGILGVQDRPRFREYVVREHIPSYRYEQELRVGTVLPEQGVTYYEVPAEYHVTGYRYTYVNSHPVLVEPRTRRVVEIID
jgi:hypothetical protein